MGIGEHLRGSIGTGLKTSKEQDWMLIAYLGLGWISGSSGSMGVC